MGLVEVITYRGDYEQAIPLYQDIYDRNEGLINTQDRAAFGLYEAYKGSNDYKEALKWHEEHGRLQDSLFIDAKDQKAIEITEKYENDKIKKAAELAELKNQKEEEIINQKLESEKAWNFTYLIAISSLVLLLIIGFVIYKQLKKTKESLLKKNKEVSDSINVASNIQSALLPNIHNFNQIGIESFVLYKPKDIVSGDFYFHHRIGDTTFFAAADCTGHGIPGAMLSFLAISILDTAVTEHSSDSIDQILFHLNEKINIKLKSKQNSLSIKVGLDITLCAYHHIEGKLEFAGTHNPLYLIRQGSISQYKGDKVNIGSTTKIRQNSFTLNQLDIQPGDSIYLMSDGFCDQKGGPKNKKFYYAPFRSMLTKNVNLPMKRQQEILDKTITEWTGNSDQIDDILVIGIKF
jgi:serine phosphatase RsbU (regulator of sigma subunit)